MAVFTPVDQAQLTPWLDQHYGLHLASEPEPISEGIENTNYKFMTVEGKAYIFTIIEVWDWQMASYCLELALHLHGQGRTVPRTLVNIATTKPCTEFANKPAAVIEFALGRPLVQPKIADCQIMGGLLADLHLAVQDFALTEPNKRGPAWRAITAHKVIPDLDIEGARLVQEGLASDERIRRAGLVPRACHCDLFRNNVLWHNDTVSAIIDFYFAGDDLYVFDFAVMAIDWTMDENGHLNTDKLVALQQGYCERRMWSVQERSCLVDSFVVAALRFWLSRLLDLQQPRPAQKLQPHDPDVFRLRLAACLKGRAALTAALHLDSS